ncbi:MAG: purine-nucleoside phosphorylase, partial [Saprospiraceae bacterium]|nr:purine-nucleoside phosphorylase [Candidatus Opimibacter iunctus]
MSLHIAASHGEIAQTVLIMGDPLRARYIAESILTEVHCYNEIRGMLGFTGMYKGKRVSVQGTGIGIPSTALYLHELIHEYGVQKIMRLGTCGGIQPDLQLHQLILVTEAYTDSSTHLLYQPDLDTPAKANGALLHQAKQIALQQSIQVIEGPVFSTDLFYSDDEQRWDTWQQRGLLAIEMESNILYNMAARNNIQALSILSVSDNVITHTSTSSDDRE